MNDARFEQVAEKACETLREYEGPSEDGVSYIFAALNTVDGNPLEGGANILDGRFTRLDLAIMINLFFERMGEEASVNTIQAVAAIYEISRMGNGWERSFVDIVLELDRMVPNDNKSGLLH